MPKPSILEVIDLFKAREGGYWNYRIPCLAVTGSGVVLATAEARPEHGGDYDQNDLILRRSVDGGENFEPPTLIVRREDYGEGPVHNLVLIPNPVGTRVVALFCHDYARVFTMVSEDDGASFHPAVEITDLFEGFRGAYDWSVCATGPGHGLRLRNGRMVVPVWLSDGSWGEFGPKYRSHRPSIVASIFSDDDGETWQRGEIVCRDGDRFNDILIRNPSETVAVELHDGGVMFNIRNDSEPRRRLIAISGDGSGGWRVRGFDPTLPEPACMGSMVRLNGSGSDQPGRILFSNPASLENNLIPPGTIFAHDRSRLTVRMSEDDGQTWVEELVLEAGPAGYSDLAVGRDGRVMCLYECGMVNHMFDPQSVRLGRFWVR